MYAEGGPVGRRLGALARSRVQVGDDGAGRRPHRERGGTRVGTQGPPARRPRERGTGGEGDTPPTRPGGAGREPGEGRAAGGSGPRGVGNRGGTAAAARGQREGDEARRRHRELSGRVSEPQGHSSGYTDARRRVGLPGLRNFSHPGRSVACCASALPRSSAVAQNQRDDEAQAKDATMSRFAHARRGGWLIPLSLVSAVALVVAGCGGGGTKHAKAGDPTAAAA